MPQKTSRLQQVDALKIALTFEILWFHTVIFFYSNLRESPFFSELNLGIVNGDKALDFFFILSGFFLFRHFDAKKTWLAFVVDRIKRFWPLIALSIFVLFSAHLLIKLPFRPYDNLFTLLLADNIGITPYGGGNAPTWWVSTLFFISSFLFYLKKYAPEAVFDLLLAFLVWFSYSFLIHIDHANLHGIAETYGYVFNVGMLRGLGGIGTGYFIQKIYSLSSPSTPSGRGKSIVFGIVEAFLLYFMARMLVLGNPPGIENFMVYFVLFVFLLWLFLIREGLITQWLCQNAFSTLARYNYAIFIMQWPILTIIELTFIKKHPGFVLDHPILSLSSTYVLCLVGGIVSFHAIKALTALKRT